MCPVSFYVTTNVSSVATVTITLFATVSNRMISMIFRGCNCPTGFLYNSTVDGVCIPEDQCPCIYNGEKYVSVLVHFPDITINLLSIFLKFKYLSFVGKLPTMDPLEPNTP